LLVAGCRSLVACRYLLDAGCGLDPQKIVFRKP
jgi:hypothetical protein